MESISILPPSVSASFSETGAVTPPSTPSQASFSETDTSRPSDTRLQNDVVQLSDQGRSLASAPADDVNDVAIEDPLRNLKASPAAMIYQAIDRLS